MHSFELSPDEKAKIEKLNSTEMMRPIISISELQSLCEGDEHEEELKELLQDMMNSCLDYTITVAKWKEMFAEKRGHIDEDMSDSDTLRSSVHNRTIGDINLFGRSLKRWDRDNSWMDKGGMDGRNRSAYGRFALTLTFSRLEERS